MNAEVLAQLGQIKWLLVVFVAVALVLAILRTWADMRRLGGARRLVRESFAERARTLLDEGSHAELLALARSRYEEAPGDASAYWYHAMAAYRAGDTATALQSIRKAGELQPDWRESHVDPFVRAVSLDDSEPPQRSSALPATVEKAPGAPPVPNGA